MHSRHFSALKENCLRKGSWRERKREVLTVVIFFDRIYFAKSSGLLRKLKWPLEKNYLSWNSVSEIFKFRSKLYSLEPNCIVSDPGK